MERRTPQQSEIARALRDLTTRVQILEKRYDGRDGGAIELPLNLGEIDVDSIYILEIGGAGNLKVTHFTTGISTHLATPTGHPDYPDNDLRTVIANADSAPDTHLRALINAVAALGTP